MHDPGNPSPQCGNALTPSLRSDEAQPRDLTLAVSPLLVIPPAVRFILKGPVVTGVHSVQDLPLDLDLPIIPSPGARRVPTTGGRG